MGLETRKTFDVVLEGFRKGSFSEQDKGYRFERLMQAYLRTDPKYAYSLEKIWLWKDFPARKDFGKGNDVGIDLVARTVTGEFWAIQCKCYREESSIAKASVDSFLATSSRRFSFEGVGEQISFSQRLWISTTNNWTSTAEEAIRNQDPPVTRLNLSELQKAPVDWGKIEQGFFGEESRTVKKALYSHQEEVLKKTHEHFKDHDRGKIIMACGTGKTLTSLRIAERETGERGLVLFLVPSIALVGQVLNEWIGNAEKPLHPICICSDPKASKKHDGFSVVDLALPASTDSRKIFHQLKNAGEREGLTVVFSTYHSIDVIAGALGGRLHQETNPLMFPEETSQKGIFDLIICDEAHRTTGVTLSQEKESAFVKVHDNDFLPAKKRLYMTATPRLYKEESKEKAKEKEAILCSMDDPALYGEEIHRIGFGRAVQQGLLTDYKVLVLTINESQVPRNIQAMIANEEYEISAEDAPKLVGCINALSKRVLGDHGTIAATDPDPMKRAVAFCGRIQDSKRIRDSFNEIAEKYLESLPWEDQKKTVLTEAHHIDGSMSATLRDKEMSWLRSETSEDRCKILTNVRCLSEGIDVPSLDAILFLSARNSEVDVVQSVGRVMRRSPGKKYGYIVIPVIIPDNIDPAKALDDNKRYKIVWSVLNALRAHDDRFDSEINKLELNKKKSGRINVVGVPGDDNGSSGNEGEDFPEGFPGGSQGFFDFGELQQAFYAKLVQKVGSRGYWEEWARDVAKIAERHIERIGALARENPKYQEAFGNFLEGLQKSINPSVSEEEAIEMLSQHIITKPVFEALFGSYSFVEHNPVSKSMQRMVDLLEEGNIAEERSSLKRFYESVWQRAQDIDNAEGKQRVIIELYDKFFRSAFPKMVEQLGIVYTPVEVVDFIVRSVEDILQREFKRSLSDENIHVLDPFTGTGTFVTRLLQSGLIRSEDLERKYSQEIHANEMVLLAYYIATINIENVFHDLSGREEHLPFCGACLTDTFQLGEKTLDTAPVISGIFAQNTERVELQKHTPLQVILGNPPYSVGQRSANDNAQNQSYESLEKRIAETYAAASTATNKNALYDSYIKAFRWASDRLDEGNGGVIAFVSNGSWIDGNSTAGLRKCFEKEFSSVYVFNLRGNARTQGELRQKEAGNVFGSGSRTPVAITVLVKHPGASGKASIFYRDIGDYLRRKEKLRMLQDLRSLGSGEMEWEEITPSEEGDWINKRNSLFDTFISLGDKGKGKSDKTVFHPIYSNGLKTQRDAWCYNSSKSVLEENVRATLDFYNEQRLLYDRAQVERGTVLDPKDVVDHNSRKISWSCALLVDAQRGREHVFEDGFPVVSLYRPFFKQHLYFSRSLNERVYQIPKLFPSGESKNLLICVSGIGASKDFSALMVDSIPDIQLIFNGQCFPLYYYDDEGQHVGKSLFEEGYSRKDGITDFILSRAQRMYGKKVTKEDIFFYVYGLLHSPDYRKTFDADLKKMLPRLPLVEKQEDFWAFSEAGRKLKDLHVDYESIPPYPGVLVSGEEKGFFRVKKMRFAKKGKEAKKETILFNRDVTITDIPLRAYDYVVNGKSAIEWVMERYQLTTHKDSGIQNDPNAWGEDQGNPRYILDLLLSVINVSVKTMDIVESLPEMCFSE